MMAYGIINEFKINADSAMVYCGGINTACWQLRDCINAGNQLFYCK
jgi:hypothetical protein